ncbi:MAG: HEAT repeat domain-containing protein [Chromatiaceae bacterium]|jgi:HEAT repeat protein|nr:HEAT repeat domain-containing protein [Chromatiaceae bacterium]
MMPHEPLPSALLFVAPGCGHCPVVLDGLGRLLKAGRLARLEAVNVTAEPELASAHGVRSVPWLRIGPFELIGALSPAELAEWVEHAASGTGWASYFTHLIEGRRLDAVIRQVEDVPGRLRDLLSLLQDESTPLDVRIGVSAVVEELADTSVLAAVVPELEQLTLSASAQTRGDACHFLGLTGDAQAIPAVRRLLDDEQADVREIAAETLALLGAGRGEAP